MGALVKYLNFIFCPLFISLLISSCATNDSANSREVNQSDYTLISAADLFGRNESTYESNERNYAVIDMQEHEDYLTSHIRNAVNITRDQISGEAFSSDGSSSKKELEKILGAVGIKPSDEIIIYDDSQNTNACRLWWLLKVFGHEKISILDGGLNYWKEVGNELVTGEAYINPVAYHFVGKERKDIFASIDDIKKGMNDTNTIVLDVRSLEEYDGTKQKDGAAYGGNIDGCSHLEFKSSLNEGGTKNQCFKTESELKELFEKKGITKDKKILVYCHSGTRSAHTTFVLTQLLGYKNVSNYDGSWIEWSEKTKSDTLVK